MLLDLLGNLEPFSKTLIALAGAVGVVVAFMRWVRPRLRSWGADIRAGRDALVGREAIIDSITGKELVPALPGMGVRMDSNERQLATLTEAVTALALSTVRLDDHERRLAVLEQASSPTVVVQQNVTRPEKDPLVDLGDN